MLSTVLENRDKLLLALVNTLRPPPSLAGGLVFLFSSAAGFSGLVCAFTKFDVLALGVVGDEFDGL